MEVGGKVFVYGNDNSQNFFGWIASVGSPIEVPNGSQFESLRSYLVRDRCNTYKYIQSMAIQRVEGDVSMFIRSMGIGLLNLEQDGKR